MSKQLEHEVRGDEVGDLRSKQNLCAAELDEEEWSEDETQLHPVHPPGDVLREAFSRSQH